MYRPSKHIVLCLLAVIAITGSLAYSCSANSSTQSTSTTQSSQPPSGQPRANAPDMQTTLTQVAQELGIPEDKLADAYQQARDSVMPSMPARNRTSQGQGQQPSQGQQPPNTSGGRQNFNDFRMSIYNKMAEILNIPADEIAAAFSKFQPQFPMNRGTTTTQ
jgi:uncharacterized protein (DUF2126 family)